MMQKERELKDAVRRDRDSEIEAAILRLEDDMHQQREELERTTENRYELVLFDLIVTLTLMNQIRR